MARNRKQTEQRIIDAAIHVLRVEGFQEWGVNRLAREAGVDKVLLYRYFASLEGILEAVVEKTDFWPDPETLPDSTPEAFIEATLEEMQANPHIRVLLSHPGMLASHSMVRRKQEADFKRWLSGFTSHAHGHIPEADLHRLPALIQHQLMIGESLLTAREMWKQVSPPLEWQRDTEPVFEEDDLPPELL